MSTLETLKAFSERLGVHKSTVTRAAQAGRLVMEGKRVVVEASLERWHATKGGRIDVEARHAQNRGAGIPEAKPATKKATRRETAQSEAQADGEDAIGNGRTQYKALVLQYENQTIKLEMALRRGLRYPVADIRREATALGATLRAAVERLVDQTAPRLAVMTSTADRQRLLAAEITRLRRLIKGEFPRAMRRMRKAAP